MKVTLIPSTVSVQQENQNQYLTSFLINDTLAIDGGCIGFFGDPSAQARIRHILISHSHIDHTASLPIFLENAYEGKQDCVTVHASDVVLDCLRRDVFNDRVWPDFLALSATNPPFLKLATLHPGSSVELEGLRITPVPVHHSVPTLGFLIEDAHSAAVFVTDTGPTDAIWDCANRAPHLRAVFLEASFPNSLTRLADAAKHLTPALFAVEARKLKRQVPLIAVHIKARYRGEVVGELKALTLPNLEIGRFGRPYEF